METYMHKSLKKRLLNCSTILIIISILLGCNFPTAVNDSTVNTPVTTTSELKQESITFIVKIPAPLSAGDSIYLSILDEVTGLAFNPKKHIMQAEDELTYSVTIPVSLGSVVKYRYSRVGANTVNEHLFNDRPVRYRLYYVEGSGKIEDVVSQWTDTEDLGKTGRIMGKVLDSSTGKPIPNILATAGGEQAYTLADGSFLLEGLPPTNQNLVLYSMDGAYKIFQQGAVVAGDSTTPVLVELSGAKLVNVTFTVNVPPNTPVDAPIRIAGNITQLGNTFADLSGGVSTLASRMPVLEKRTDGIYSVSLKLPVGTYLEYKYTLGDGLWSSELTSSGYIKLRQLIVPASKHEQNDLITTWQTDSLTPLRFVTKVPAETPKNEVVSIQFNPGFGWMEPLPMTDEVNALGEQTWYFYLTGPLNNLTQLRYRYCRQYQCGAADDAETMGQNPEGRSITLAPGIRIVEDVVSSWAWLSKPTGTLSSINDGAKARGKDFIAGAAFQSTYHPSWEPLYSQAIEDIQTIGINLLVFSPTWTFTNDSPPILEPLTSQDILWPDLLKSIKLAQENKLLPGLYPVPQFMIHEDMWWQNASRDFPWWVSFFEQYTNFILHHASLAASVKSPTFIIGGDWLNPALPNGSLADGTPSNVPQDSEARWRDLIRQIRERYKGSIVWALPFPNGVVNPPPFLDAVDEIYILWSASLASQQNTSADEMKIQANIILNEQVLPFQQQVAKPIIIAFSYPSVDGGAAGCITVSGGGCIDYDQLSLPNPDIVDIPLNLQEQANAYDALLAAINENTWISGYVSMGYYPPAILQDKSISIHGKPASEILQYWSQGFLNR
jgi:hypothetical protein